MRIQMLILGFKGLIWLHIGQYVSLVLFFVHYLESLWKIFLFRWILNHSSQESKGGAVVRALTFLQCGLGSNLGINTIIMWVVIICLPVLSFAPRGFSPGTPVFPSRQKTTLSNSNLTRNHQVDEEPLSGSATSKFCYCLFIYLFTGY